MAEISFNVREKADATAFYIYNTGTTVSTDLTLTVSYASVSVGTFSITGDDLIAFNTAGGLELTTSDINYATSTFLDGIYTFTLNDGVDDSTHVEGFPSIIKLDVIKEALSYRAYQTKAVKDYIVEKNMLLTNLKYSATVGDASKFNENLLMLQRMR